MAILLFVFIFINNVSASETKTLKLETSNEFELLSGSVSISQEIRENFFSIIDRENVNSTTQTVSLNYDLLENNTIYTIDIEYSLKSKYNNSNSIFTNYFDRKVMTGSEIKALSSLNWNSEVELFYPSKEWLENENSSNYVNLAFYSNVRRVSYRLPILVSPKAVKGALYYGEKEGNYHLLVKDNVTANESEGFTFEEEMLKAIKLEFDSATHYDEIKFDTNTGGTYFLETVEYMNQLYISPRDYIVSIMTNKEGGYGYKEIYYTGRIPFLQDTVLHSPTYMNFEIQYLNYNSLQKTLDIDTAINKGDFTTIPTNLGQKMQIRVLQGDKTIIEDSSEHLFTSLKNLQLDGGTYTVEVTLNNIRATKNFVVASNEKDDDIPWIKWKNEPITNDPMKKWNIQLSLDIDPTTVNNKNIYLQGNTGKISTKVEIGNEPNTIVVYAPENGYLNGNYTLYIKDLKSIDQKKLSEPIKMNFTVKGSSNKITSMFDFFYPGFDWSSKLNELTSFVKGKLIYEAEDYIGIDVEDRFGYTETMWGYLSNDGKRINEIHLTFEENKYYSNEKLEVIYNDLLSNISQLTGMKPVTVGTDNNNGFYAAWEQKDYTGRLYLSVKNKNDLKMSSIVLYIYN